MSEAQPVVQVRAARLDELAALARLEREADQRFLSVGLDVVLDAPPTTADDYAPACDDGRLLVAEDAAERLVGFVRLELADGEAHVEQLSVAADHAGNGIGRVLLAAAEAWALAHGHEVMTLCTYRDVPWNGPYYERLGWRPLPDADCGPQLRALRRRERELGLEVHPRQAMVKRLR